MIKIPRRLDDLVPTAAIEKVLDVLNQPELYQGVKDAVGKGVKDVNPVEKMQSAWQQTRMWLEEVAVGRSATQPSEIINASGQIFNSQFSGLPTLPVVAYGYAKAASTYRGHDAESARAHQIVQSLTSAKYATFTSSVYASLLAATTAIGVKRIAVANSDQVRLPALGNIGSMLDMLPTEIARVGATSGANEAAWQSAVSDASTAILLVSPNGLDDASNRTQRKAALDVAKRADAKVIEILADGVLNSQLASSTGLVDVRAHIDEGVTAILPLNAILGAPAGCLVAGNEPNLSNLATLATNMGIELSTAGLSAAANSLQMHGSDNELDSGSQMLFDVNLDNLKDRARRMAVQVNDFGPIESAREVEQTVALGPAPWNCHKFPTWSVELTPRDSSELINRMQGQSSSSSIAFDQQDGKFLLHLRFVPAGRDHEIVNILTALTDNQGQESQEDATPSGES
ncbi:MAG: hypothetical protein Aurels2KO_47450 [Aureliella sp.]